MISDIGFCCSSKKSWFFPNDIAKLLSLTLYMIISIRPSSSKSLKKISLCIDSFLSFIRIELIMSFFSLNSKSMMIVFACALKKKSKLSRMSIELSDLYEILFFFSMIYGHPLIVILHNYISSYLCFFFQILNMETCHYQAPRHTFHLMETHLPM